MPLSKSGKKVKREMECEYGKEKGDSVFYAVMNKRPGMKKKWEKSR